MAIFLSSFLALLTNVDVAGEGLLSALAGILVAINVLLVLAVLFAPWFRVKPPVGNSCETDNTLTFATAMLTAQRDTNNSTRPYYDGSDNITDTSLVRRGSSTLDPPATGRGAVASYDGQGGGESGVT